MSDIADDFHENSNGHEASLGEVSSEDLSFEDNDVLVLEEVADPELVLPVWEATGNAEVDAALELMQSLDPDSIHTHVNVLGEVHGRLHQLMSNLDR